MKPERSYYFLAVLLVIHLLFLLSSAVRTPVSLTDSADYLNASNNIYRQGVLYSGDLAEPMREEQYTRRPPLYPFLLGVAVLTGSHLPSFLLQIIFSMFSIILVIKIFAQYHPGNIKQRHCAIWSAGTSGKSNNGIETGLQAANDARRPNFGAKCKQKKQAVNKI